MQAPQPLAAALMLGVAAHAAQAAGPGAPSEPVSGLPGDEGPGVRWRWRRRRGGWWRIKRRRRRWRRAGGGDGGGPGLAAASSGGGGGRSIAAAAGERGFVNRGGGDAVMAIAARPRGGDGGSRSCWQRTWRREGRGDRRGRHRYSRDRGGVRIYLGPGYGYYDGDYDYSCEWLRRRAISHGQQLLVAPFPRLRLLSANIEKRTLNWPRVTLLVRSRPIRFGTRHSSS